jgi:hypothetical protein
VREGKKKSNLYAEPKKHFFSFPCPVPFLQARKTKSCPSHMDMISRRSSMLSLSRNHDMLQNKDPIVVEKQSASDDGLGDSAGR